MWSAKAFIPLTDDEACELLSDLPTRPKCGGLAGANVRMFGDRDWSDQRAVFQDYRQASWLREISNPVVIEIGAGIAIPSAPHFSPRMTFEFGATVIQINLTHWQVPHALEVVCQ